MSDVLARLHRASWLNQPVLFDQHEVQSLQGHLKKLEEKISALQNEAVEKAEEPPGVQTGESAANKEMRSALERASWFIESHEWSHRVTKYCPYCDALNDSDNPGVHHPSCRWVELVKHCQSLIAPIERKS